MDKLPILTLIILTPAVGGVLLAFLDRRYVRELRQGALLISFVTLLLCLGLLVQFDGSDPGLQLEEQHDWIPSLGIGYHLGVDGISILLVLLTAALHPFILLSTWSSVKDRVKEFQICMLLLQSGMLGAFLALDLILFYLFWEAMLIPMYILIGVWGGTNRIYAAVKFFIYTMVGSLMMFLAILYLGSYTGTFDFVGIQAALRSPAVGPLDFNTQCWLFAAFALSFAIKVPLFPFHTWLPHAHVEAPTAGSVVLAGVLLKMGTYGFLRFSLPLFSEAAQAAAPIMCWLAVIGIIYGACMALVQNDIKKLIAYSSVSHLGFVMVGIFVWNEHGLNGAVLQMVNHGISTSMLFLLIGVIYERRHTRELSDYGGIARSMPIFCTFFILATLSSIGLPGLNGFVGEFLVLLGVFTHSWVYGALSATGVVLGAVYMLTLVKRFMFGPIVHEENRNLADVNTREWIYLTPFVVLMVWIGLYPKPLLQLIGPALKNLVSGVQ